jgi:hypothetical protein
MVREDGYRACRWTVASRPVDLRNGMDGLAALVQQALRENPVRRRSARVPRQAGGPGERPGLGRHGSVLVPRTPGERRVRLAAGTGWSGSLEHGATRAIATGRNAHIHSRSRTRGPPNEYGCRGQQRIL